ncbi:MAG TPA: hypothetical protein DCQ26_18170 [Marinilabiliales bacterium]|nr:MAG: Fe-S-oxidoreductase [Bacteroidetes bacterium GWA2_40_14]OFX61568.1 MAG: Fe-S-oxidoreductase [Bacteroidetes bacterium GWC2_40_13]OFX73591.1 MAG: Fe-S-oxidoreductase [Bacteroidetes bacterium GWD2_40_43]OFX90858.1 MAG: Fe-S-oxidoreductase [Bacteroidetes bacterium GWE2_40_63]OFY20630.1 MAG: Fe-S-oxidoreductase [Bacteroidetes bacterium GWF2_40_13]OFZ24715.1 MAG: Fe-S-oxidoreductase [Bacteroidetes bacterium RIFOXYC2_FULL_40_12]HAN00524.1 hypothetical protein [Marinilabiliales bacterium]
MAENKLYDPAFLKQQAAKTSGSSKKHLNKVKAKRPRKLDELFQLLHNRVFNEIDCLKCANCCRNLGPRLTQKDIERLAKAVSMKPVSFIEKYLRIDEDRDYVFKGMPCPFLASDNYCMVYENRPKACRDYPHTDAPKMLTLLNLALKNLETCPAVYLIVEELKQIPINEIK